LRMLSCGEKPIFFNLFSDAFAATRVHCSKNSVNFLKVGITSLFCNCSHRRSDFASELAVVTPTPRIDRSFHHLEISNTFNSRV
jgi:hypothetical protein